MSKSMTYLIVRAVFIAVAFVLISAQFFGGALNAMTLQLGALGVVATFGMSHGSLDWMIAKYWNLRNTLSQNIFFIFIYISCVLITLLLWDLSSIVGLIIFFMISLSHFSDDWRDELIDTECRWVGAGVLSFSALHYPQAVQALFGLLVPIVSAEYLTYF